MMLLFDENLSSKLPGLLKTLFPDSAHVRERGLLGRPDEEGWEYARANGFTIVSKDSDFQQRSLFYGHPPKLVWLRVGNCTQQRLGQLIRRTSKTFARSTPTLSSQFSFSHQAVSVLLGLSPRFHSAQFAASSRLTI